MTRTPYEQLLDPCTKHVAESSSNYHSLSERHLHAVWFEQKYLRPLETSEGDPIEILSPGIWNIEAGPDFLKAHVKIGENEFRGDIELHLNDEGWTQHQHHKDPGYDNVILHISLWEPARPKPVITHAGDKIPRTYLDPKLTISHRRLIQLIDLDLYPYKQFTGSGNCSSTLFQHIHKEEIQSLMRYAADWRLKQKSEFLRAHVEDPGLRVGAGIAMALGYKQNTYQFLQLFNQLLTFQDRSQEDLLAQAMGICGFFREKYEQKWTESPKYKKLRNFPRSDSLHIPLQLSQIRPYNHPIRRLVYLTFLLRDRKLHSLEKNLHDTWDQNWSQLDCKDLRQQLQEVIPEYPDAYWNHHYTFELESKKEFLSLIGEQLKNSILINTFLPLLRQNILGRGHSDEIQAFRSFYSTFPSSKTNKIKYLTHRFLGDTGKSSLFNKAFIEQGAYQIHRDFCQHYEASCEGCPFVDRYKSAFR